MNTGSKGNLTGLYFSLEILQFRFITKKTLIKLQVICLVQDKTFRSTLLQLAKLTGIKCASKIRNYMQKATIICTYIGTEAIICSQETSKCYKNYIAFLQNKMCTIHVSSCICPTILFQKYMGWLYGTILQFSSHCGLPG